MCKKLKMMTNIIIMMMMIATIEMNKKIQTRKWK